MRTWDLKLVKCLKSFLQMQNTSPFLTYNTQYKELRSTHLLVFILMEHDLYNYQKLPKATEIDIYRELVQLVQAVTVFVCKTLTYLHANYSL